MNGADDVVTAWYEAISDGQDGHSLVQDRYGARSLVAEIGDRARTVRSQPGCALTRDLGDEAIEQAVAAAREADVVVLALGVASLWFTGEPTEGEASDTADITLPAAQVRLAEAVVATGTPIVVVLVQGRAYALPEVLQEAAAILVAPYAGPFGTRSVTDVLFGAVNPSGKLPYSVPRHSGQIPVYHHQKAGSGYRNPLPTSTTSSGPRTSPTGSGSLRWFKRRTTPTTSPPSTTGCICTTTPSTGRRTAASRRSTPSGWLTSSLIGAAPGASQWSSTSQVMKETSNTTGATSPPRR